MTNGDFGEKCRAIVSAPIGTRDVTGLFFAKIPGYF
jgi:hypothetical protein